MENTPRNIVLQLGALITMYVSASFLLTLIFGIINLVYPMATETYWDIESSSQSVRLGIAMVIVFVPVFLILTRLVNEHRRNVSVPLYQAVTKWLIYLSLLFGGLVMMGTLVTVIYTFLEGEITTRFVLKAFFMIFIVGSAFHYYLLDAKGYWVTHESRSILYGIGVIIVVFAVMAYGFKYIETPATVREMKLDETQVNDLRNIQWQIDSYMAISSSSVPESLEEAYKDSATSVPTAPDGREAYSYEKTAKGFKLCATFAKDSIENNTIETTYVDPMARIKNPDNWSYKAGRYCFERVVK